MRLRLAWVILLAVPAQLFITRDPWHLLRDPGLAGLFLMASYVPIVGFVAANLRNPGFAVVALGLTANLLVMLANGGLMPVSPESRQAAGYMDLSAGTRNPSGKGIILPASETRLVFLSDTIVTPPMPRPVIVSLGDLLMFAGLVYGAQAVVRRRASGPGQEHSHAAIFPVASRD